MRRPIKWTKVPKIVKSTSTAIPLSGVPERIEKGFASVVSLMKLEDNRVFQRYHPRYGAQSKQSYKELRKSLLEKGFTEPITVTHGIDTTYRGKDYEDFTYLWNGTHRLKIAHRLGIKEVPVEVIYAKRPKVSVGKYPKRRKK